MAKKTIFKGVINGKEFDNVLAYNQEMQTLITKGENINASSQTSIEDDNNCCGNCETCDKCQESIDFLPYFSNPKEYYLDRLIVEDGTTNVKNIEELKMSLTRAGKHILNSVNEMDAHALENYKKDIKDVIKVLDSDKIDNENSLVSLSKKINMLRYADKVINLMNDFYSDIYNRINDIEKVVEPACEAKPNTIKDFEDVNAMFESIFGPMPNKITNTSKKNLQKLLSILNQSFDDLFSGKNKNMA